LSEIEKVIMTETQNPGEKLIGIEVGNSLLTAVCISSEGSIIDTFEAPVLPEGETAAYLGHFVNELKSKFGDFSEIGLAVPGLVDRRKKRVAFSTHIPEHAKIDLLSEISKLSGVKISIENDANAAAYGEYRFGAGQGTQDMFYVKLGDGVGGAIIINERLWHGVSGFAGEFGYMAINSEGMRLEDLASSQNILHRTRNRFHQDPTSSLNKIGEDNITIADLIRGADNEDNFSELMLERTGFYIGTAIAGVINLLNIEKIVIDGDIMTSRNIVLDSIKDRAQELSFSPSFETVEIVQGRLGRNAGAIGAALLADANS